ncbi:hypothetical protein GALMADRAFT_817810 [Galerina marginata CBS 339.88]|uniref:Uncharacterized protein n=1 Tax=Galerina marginata (strain CBS 339.88) TaxID=685588 RepID=A0A067TTP5_GALM3|nr:hypothetical protein GALMADRAFT_817810 [Galerina marginata CBS 339.88]
MASPPPPRMSIRKSLRRGLDRARDTIFPTSRSSSKHSAAGTTAANIPNGAPGVPSSALPVAKSVDKVGKTPGVTGNQFRGTILPTPSTPSQQTSSPPEPNTSDKLKTARDVTWSALKAALRLLGKSADACPPLKSAVGVLVACLDLAQVVGENHGEYEKLATELTTMANTLAPYVTKLGSEDVSGSVARIMDQSGIGAHQPTARPQQDDTNR